MKIADIVRHSYSRSTLVVMVLVAAAPALACPTCGQDKGFTPEMLLMTMTFALLPLTIMLALGWRILRENERQKPPERPRNTDART